MPDNFTIPNYGGYDAPIQGDASGVAHDPIKMAKLMRKMIVQHTKHKPRMVRRKHKTKFY